MKVKMVFLHFATDGTAKAQATIDVAGLGEVKIEHALSEELHKQVCAECETALRLRLGQALPL